MATVNAPSANIEVDPKVYENDDSDYGSAGYDTSSTSLSSSVHEYIFENGRRYHAYFGEDKNLLPTDEKEQDRMDLHNEILLRLFDGKLHKSPLKDPQRILDVGTGTGIWAIDMADRYPMAEVIGIDLSPIQPSWVPPNCKFTMDDAEKPWTYADNTFDFIHFRNVAQAISNWPAVMAEAYRCLKPGGYIEMADTNVDILCDDGTMKPDNPAKVYCDILNTALDKIGKPTTREGDIDKLLTNAGLEGLHTFAVRHPWGPWAKDKRLKEVGVMMLLQGQTAFPSYGLAALTRILGYDVAKAQKICNDGYQATRNKNTHMYSVHYVGYAQKPLKN